jgi:hypothetical protein
MISALLAKDAEIDDVGNPSTKHMNEMIILRELLSTHSNTQALEYSVFPRLAL